MDPGPLADIWGQIHMRLAADGVALLVVLYLPKDTPKRRVTPAPFNIEIPRGLHREIDDIKKPPAKIQATKI